MEARYWQGSADYVPLPKYLLQGQGSKLPLPLLPGRPSGASLALVIAVRRAALSGEAVSGAGPPQCVHLSGLCVTAAGGAVPEAGEGWPDLDPLGRDGALDGLPELVG